MKPRQLLLLPLLAVLSLPHADGATGTAITGDVTVDTRNTNLPPYAIPSATVSNAATGKVMLTLGVRHSSDLSSFTLLPATAPQVTITPEGEIQFEFDAPADSGFYRIEAK